MSGARPTLVGSLPVRSPEDLGLVEEALKSGCDLVELRLDYMEKPVMPDIVALIRLRDRIVITVRDVAEGGASDIDLRARIGLLEQAASVGYKVDIEYDTFRMMSLEKAFIISRHYLLAPPEFEEMNAIIAESSPRCTIVKIACKAGKHVVPDLVRLLDSHSNVAVMEIGGDPHDRIAFSILGSRLLYCHIGEPTAKGQMSCSRARKMMDELWPADQ